MLAFFVALQTGQKSRPLSHGLHEQRCLQGKNRTHEIRELQIRQIILFFPRSMASSSPPTLLLDSASSLAPDEILSLICSSAWLSDATTAWFSCTALCRSWFSICNLVRNCSSSILLLFALAISSSFCWNRTRVLVSIWFSNTPICWFLFCCRSNLNLSLCFRKIKINQKKNANYNLRKRRETEEANLQSDEPIHVVRRHFRHERGGVRMIRSTKKIVLSRLKNIRAKLMKLSRRIEGKAKIPPLQLQLNGHWCLETETERKTAKIRPRPFRFQNRNANAIASSKQQFNLFPALALLHQNGTRIKNPLSSFFVICCCFLWVSQSTVNYIVPSEDNKRKRPCYALYIYIYLFRI